MDEIIAHLKKSITDEVLSKEERKTLRELVAQYKLGPDQLNFLRSKIFELANEKVTDRTIGLFSSGSGMPIIRYW